MQCRFLTAALLEFLAIAAVARVVAPSLGRFAANRVRRGAAGLPETVDVAYDGRHAFLCLRDGVRFFLGGKPGLFVFMGVQIIADKMHVISATLLAGFGLGIMVTTLFCYLAGIMRLIRQSE